jgi:hypothetical protein
LAEDFLSNSDRLLSIVAECAGKVILALGIAPLGAWASHTARNGPSPAIRTPVEARVASANAITHYAPKLSEGWNDGQCSG